MQKLAFQINKGGSCLHVVGNLTHNQGLRVVNKWYYISIECKMATIRIFKAKKTSQQQGQLMMN